MPQQPCDAFSILAIAIMNSNVSTTVDFQVSTDSLHQSRCTDTIIRLHIVLKQMDNGLPDGTAENGIAN